MNRPRRTVVIRSGAGRATPAVRRWAVALAVAAATAVVAGPAAVRATDGDNHIAVTAVSNPTAVTSGDDVQYVVTASNKNTTSNSHATTLTDTIACSPSGACGTITSIAQTAGPDTWSCRVVSSTEGVCELPSGMANKATDTFSVIAQTATALAGTMTDTAKVDTVDVGGVSSSAASATTTVTAADDTGGGTTTGFCPNTGCTISSGGEPSANGTVGAITFPPFSGSGFTYSFSLSPGSFCGTSVVACTGLTMETGPLAGPGPGQTFTASDPVVVNLVYGPGITPSSPDSLTTLAFKSDTASGPGTLIPSCGSPVVTPCARPASRDGAGALVTTILMSSGDPRVGNLYIP